MTSDNQVNQEDYSVDQYITISQQAKTTQELIPNFNEQSYLLIDNKLIQVNCSFLIILI